MMNDLQSLLRRIAQLLPSPKSKNYELLADRRDATELPQYTGRGSPLTTTRTSSTLSSLGKWGRIVCVRPSFKRILAILAVVFALVVVGVLWSGIPPSFDTIRQYERSLPQHNLALPAPEGASGMYIRFPDHLWGHGFNNVLQEMFLMAHLSFLLERAYVFEEYTWSHVPFPYTITDFALRPKAIPINAFVAGPIAGGAMPINHNSNLDPHPRAVDTSYWELVCPEQKRVRVSSEGSPRGSENTGQEIMEWWVRRLRNETAQCLEVENDPRIFDPFLFGNKEILSLWPSLSTSPILTSFAWSPLVQSAAMRNFFLHTPDSASSLFLPTSAPVSSASPPSPPVSKGLVAIHLRRGDYIRHCPRLAHWNSTFMGYNQFPSLPDHFTLLPPTTPLPLRESHYTEHCWPSIPQIVTKLNSIRAEHPEWELKRVFASTNGWGWWVNELRDALKVDGWEDMKSSLDVILDREQGYVAVAVDMAIAERAEVFVGNGFSSLTSNIVMLRMSKGMDPSTIRFW